MAGASEPAATLPCEFLDWDSDFFGFPIARVRGSTLDEASAARIDEWCAESGVRCLYFLADGDALETAQVADAHGYRVVDVRLTLRHELDSLPAAPPPVAVRDAGPADIPALMRVAARSHRDTRFSRDPGFDQDRCDTLYATWVEAGIRDPERWALVAEIDGAPVGYQVISPAVGGGAAHMEILAVDEAHRGLGAGRSLLSTGLRRARSLGASAVETATQERNEASLRVHLEVGFSQLRKEIWHHKWFGQ
jgi:dTDP-4-amino-4,6-dideoxy-D-galactose acyltransferase